MTKATAKRKITALDINKMTALDVKKLTDPTDSGIAGQFMVLQDEVKIDDQTAIEVLGEDETIEVASGSTFCVYDTNGKGEVAPVKLHATQAVTMKGPLIWGRLPTIDILPIVSKPANQTVDTTEETALCTVVLGAMYAIGSAPFAVAGHHFFKNDSLPALIAMILFAVAAGALLLFILGKIELYEAEAHEEAVKKKFKTSMRFTTPDIDGLITTAKKSAA